jgi:hypothetical protein
MARLRKLPAGAALAGLMLLGASVPASAQALTWSVVPSPNAGVIGSTLGGVSCASATVCMAVGVFYKSDDGNAIGRTLAESWAGTGWTGVPSPNPGPADNSNSLQGVSCASATACMAVGDSQVSGSPEKTLTESWNGTGWTVLHSPDPATAEGNLLSGVSCASATACMAVGVSHLSGPYETLIESWNGTGWTVLPSPNPPTAGGNLLSGVSCTSATACTAVGYSYVSGSAYRTLIESWDGTSWTVVPSRNPGVNDGLFGVSCVSATACMAVGNTASSGGVSRSLTESWDGTSWTAVPGGDSNASTLEGVSCTSATACTAAGISGGASSFPGTTLIESWDGTSWTVVPSPSRGTGSNVLLGVSCVSATACTAAGYSDETKPGGYKTLIESGTASG